MRQYLFAFMCMLFCLSLWGCQTSVGNVGQLRAYQFQAEEAGWIRAGEPIEFEGARWFPIDNIENLLDSEVLVIGEYRGVQFFVDKIDVRPYNRLYTKYGRNQFRVFEKREKG